MDPNRPWKQRASRHLFQSPWFSIRQDQVELPGGEVIDYTLVEHPGYAMVVPLLADGRVVMERIYRYTLGSVTLECPSGGLDGDPPDQGARRELEEETGYRAGRMHPLGRLAGTPGIGDEVLHVFLATELSQDGNLRREPTEQIELTRVPLAELVERVYRGELETAPTALSILLAARYAAEQGLP